MKLVATIQSCSRVNNSFNKQFGVYYNDILKEFNYFYIESKFEMNKLQRKIYSDEIFNLLRNGHYSYQKTMNESKKLLNLKEAEDESKFIEIWNKYDIVIYDEKLWTIFTLPELI